MTNNMVMKLQFGLFWMFRVIKYALYIYKAA